MSVLAGPNDDVAALDLGDPRHLRAIYLDLLGRTPTAAEAAMAKASRGDILLRRLVGSAEFWQTWYEEELYYFLLIDNFRPDDGVDLTDPLERGELHVLDAVRALVSGSAFNRRNPGNDTFVSVVFEQLLGLTVQDSTGLLEAGKRMYDGRRTRLLGDEGDSQADIVRIVCAQPDFAESFVARQYARLVGREASREDRAAWGARLLERPFDFTELVREWVGSTEYAARLARLRAKSDAQFIRSLYVDLTGAPPDYDSYQRMRGALASLADAGPLRSVLARALLQARRDELPERDQIDPEQWIPETFVRFLGRPPSSAELQDFLLVYRQQEAEPATIVLSLVTHWEYQYY